MSGNGQSNSSTVYGSTTGQVTKNALIYSRDLIGSTIQYLWEVVARWVLIAFAFVFLLGMTVALYEAINFQDRVAQLVGKGEPARRVLLAIDDVNRKPIRSAPEETGLPFGTMAIELDGLRAAANSLQDFRLIPPTTDTSNDSETEPAATMSQGDATNAPTHQNANETNSDNAESDRAAFESLATNLTRSVGSLREALIQSKPGILAVEYLNDLSRTVASLRSFNLEEPAKLDPVQTELLKGYDAGAAFDSMAARLQTDIDQLQDLIVKQQYEPAIVDKLQKFEDEVIKLDVLASADTLTRSPITQATEDTFDFGSLENGLEEATQGLERLLIEEDSVMVVAMSIAQRIAQLQEVANNLPKLQEDNDIVFLAGEERLEGPEAVVNFEQNVSALQKAVSDLTQTMQDRSAPVLIAQVIPDDSQAILKSTTIWHDYESLDRFRPYIMPFGVTAGSWIDISEVGLNPRGIATLNHEALTLLFVFAMGAIGSLIYITKYHLQAAMSGVSFRQRKAHPMSWLIFRPAFGVVVALAVYLLVKAGQFAFGGGADVSQGTSLNFPIFSVIALFAGLLSWQALEMIESRGRLWFSSQSRTDLWAAGLANGLRNSNKSESECAHHIGRSIEQIQRWLMFRDKVTPEMQDRISTWLGKPREEIFSQIRPELTSGQGPLWGTGLHTAIEASRIDIESIAEMMETEIKRVQAWVSLDRRVPVASQWRLVGILERSHSSIFSDSHPTDLVWAVGLRSALQKRERKTSWLANKINCDPSLVQRWAELQSAVPTAFREPIAESLSIGLDELFSSDKPDQPDPLWAVGLRDALDKAEIKRSVLAMNLDLDRQTIENWAELEAPVYGAAQRRLQLALPDTEPSQLYASEKPELNFAWADDLPNVLEKSTLSIGELAEQIDIQISRLESWLNDEKPVPPATQRRIAEVLRQPVERLFVKIKPAA